eukprot:749930-Hanusia_phi.AAC.1
MLLFTSVAGVSSPRRRPATGGASLVADHPVCFGSTSDVDDCSDWLSPSCTTQSRALPRYVEMRTCGCRLRLGGGLGTFFSLRAPSNSPLSSMKDIDEIGDANQNQILRKPIEREMTGSPARNNCCCRMNPVFGLNYDYLVPPASHPHLSSLCPPPSLQH